ncbi:hypothetical protein [Amycolatopsis speibonae]|uniref:Uncharacterized protein n=1 Tax=Amycolatopsis speibonae TaxID=1450224 RepID=A0ABV7P4J8_9PSEU
MGKPLEDLCAVLREVEDPDRFIRPQDFDEHVARERFDALARRLGDDFGPVAEARAPDGQVQGRLSLADPAVEIVIGKFGDTLWTSDTIPRAVRDVLIRDFSFGFIAPLSALDKPAPGAEAHRPLDARTPAALQEQILDLPSSPPELAALRDWLCRELEIPRRVGPGKSETHPEQQLLTEAERLRAVVLAGREGREAKRWLMIDDAILAAPNIIGPLPAIIRLFGVRLPAAQDLLFERRALLPELRPYAGAFL